MNKLSYINRALEKREPCSGELPTIPSNGDGIISEDGGGIGRGYSMPGEPAIPIHSEVTESDEFPLIRRRKKRLDYNDLLSLLVPLGDELDRADDHRLANFLDFLIKKIAKQNSLDYSVLFGDLVLRISESDIEDKTTAFREIISKYNKVFSKLMSLGEERSTASMKAYQASARKAETYLSSGLNKRAQMLEQNPVYIAEELHNIIKIMINNMSPNVRMKSFQNVKNKVSDFNVMEIASKRAPGGAAIGVSLGLIKNVLNGKDPYFINIVISELIRRL